MSVTSTSALRARVRQLYKAFLWVGRDYPGGIDMVRRRAKEAFLKNRDICDAAQIEECIERGKFVVKQIEELIQFKKYRHLRRQYYPDDDERQQDHCMLHGIKRGNNDAES